MKLVFIISAALCCCELALSDAPAASYGTPDLANSTPRPVEIKKDQYNFQTFYQGAFPPAQLPATNFLSQPLFQQQYLLSLSQKPLYSSLPDNRQGVFPPISQVVPPISQIVPPVFGGSSQQPSFPVNPPQVFPPQVLPPQVQVPRYTPQYYYAPLTQFSFVKSPFPYPYFPVSQNKEPVRATETLSAAYGPPTSEAEPSPAAPEPEGPAESSAPFDPAPAPPQVSFPYEPAAPESSEAESFKPAPEYGLPSVK